MLMRQSCNGWLISGNRRCISRESLCSQLEIIYRFDEAFVISNRLPGKYLICLLTWKNGDLKPSQLRNHSWKERQTRLDDLKATRWAKEKFGDAKETVQALNHYQTGHENHRLS